MRINLTVEVESREALATILQYGRDYSLFDCRVLQFEILPDASAKPSNKPSSKRKAKP